MNELHLTTLTAEALKQLRAFSASAKSAIEINFISGV